MRRVNNSGRCKFILHYAMVTYEIKNFSKSFQLSLTSVRKKFCQTIFQNYFTGLLQLLVKYRCELGNVVAVEHLWDYCSKVKASVPGASDKLGE